MGAGSIGTEVFRKCLENLSFPREAVVTSRKPEYSISFLAPVFVVVNQFRISFAYSQPVEKMKLYVNRSLSIFSHFGWKTDFDICKLLYKTNLTYFSSRRYLRNDRGKWRSYT